MKREIIYYTHNQCSEDILATCRTWIELSGLPITVVSLYRLDWRPKTLNNLVELDQDPGILTMFRQQLLGLESTDADIIYFCEHDVLYHPGHFDFTPPQSDVYYYNTHVWAVDADSGQALTYNNMRMTSGLVAYRSILAEHYKKKIKWVEKDGKFSQRKMGYEPGRRRKPGRENDYAWEEFTPTVPNVDIKHGQNVTRKRFSPEQYNSRVIRGSFRLADEIPWWGVTKGRFKEFLRDAYRKGRADARSN